MSSYSYGTCFVYPATLDMSFSIVLYCASSQLSPKSHYTHPHRWGTTIESTTIGSSLCRYIAMIHQFSRKQIVPLSLEILILILITKSPHAPTPNKPGLPNLPTTPVFRPNCLSICAAPIPFSSLIVNTCLNVTTSKNCRPSAPAFPTCPNSLSASSASLYLAVNKLTAGFCLTFSCPC